ncbi:YceI family protein [Pseudoluteimonas lycopersici]|uniref:YceI family protein n=1 Tax=Pseudoluteimonas lycopersici TaxID=1324796 RepID=UPI001FE6D202|nr:YceI family protein [Lysobacter lycopersici]
MFGRVIATGACACVAFVAWVANAQDFDRARSRIGFELQTRWGQRLEGVFPDFEGDVEVLPDGRHRVRMTLRTASVEIIGHPNYTSFSRGDGFFAAERYPQVSFLSDPYPVALLRQGGPLHGVLEMHGVRRRQAFTIAPTPMECARPAYDCDLQVEGSVRRGDYGIDAWQIAVRDRVRFLLRVRLGEARG